MAVVTRFAPSPTGTLHTGNARTALYNWLYSQHSNGKFLLRIEDTDQERSKQEHTDVILRDLTWLGITWDQEIVHQSRNLTRHQEVAKELLNKGNAYYCYASEEEIEKFRNENPNKKFASPWRDKDASQAPAGGKPVVRLKVAKEGQTTITDLIQGEISIANQELDDMVLLRSDGTPTYMLAVVVDDHDMGISHIIRGDDHLTNAFRQQQIYLGMDWKVPEFAHIPLIHDKTGRKLSKREGALGLDAYRKLGYLPEAVFNHLLRLGWGHGNDEIISREQAIEWFTLEGVGKSPARFDIDKLNSINAHYMRALSNETLFAKMQEFTGVNYEQLFSDRIIKGMDGLKPRANTLAELAEAAQIYIEKRTELDEKSKEVLAAGGNELLAKLIPSLDRCEESEWNKDKLHDLGADFAAKENIKPGLVMQNLRAGVVGTFAAPGVYEVMEILGKKEVMNRLSPFAANLKGMTAHG